jgi:hypothetical protein
MMTDTAPALTAQDRCDRCGAQAYAAYDVAGMTLLFCAHHNREHGPVAVAKGATLTIDETASLTSKES